MRSSNLEHLKEILEAVAAILVQMLPDVPLDYIVEDITYSSADTGTRG